MCTMSYVAAACHHSVRTAISSCPRRASSFRSTRRRLLDRHRHVPIEQGYLNVDTAQVAPIHRPADLRPLSHSLCQNPIHCRLKVESILLGHRRAAFFTTVSRSKCSVRSCDSRSAASHAGVRLRMS
jgi:hypothetical protein